MATIHVEDLSYLDTLADAESVLGAGRSRPKLEALEGREVPALASLSALAAQAPAKAASPIAFVGKGMLDVVVTGTEQGDRVFVSSTGNDLVGTVTVRNEATGATQSYGRSQVARVLFDGKGGDDVFVNNTNVPALAHGGDGDDVLIGGSAADVLFGDGGADRLDGGDGGDFLFGGTNKGVGDRVVKGTSTVYFDNVLVGGKGDDRLFGAEGNDRLDGGDDSDALHGFGGNDVLHGGDGNDYLFGGDHWDVLVGQGGNDVLFANDAGKWISPGLDPDYRARLTSTAPRDAYGRAQEQLFGDYAFDGAGNRVPDSSGKDAGEGDDVIHGTTGSDAIFGGAGQNTIYGYGGIDFINRKPS